MCMPDIHIRYPSHNIKMEEPNDKHKETELTQEELEFQHIRDVEILNPSTMWKITKNNFHKWACDKYYPKLIEHLNKYLIGFDEWQRTWFMDSEKIISLGINNCIEPKGDSKNPYKYIIQVQRYDSNQLTISEQNIDGEVKEGGPYFTEHYKKVDSFISYFDWINRKAIDPSPKVENNDLLYYYQFSAPYSPDVGVKILHNFELLKMGGIIVPLNKISMLNTKQVEYANLSNTIYKGPMPTGGHPMTISSSFCYNLIFDNCDLSIVTFYKCRMLNLKIIKCNIRQWNFIDCEISGEIKDTELTRVNFIGGNVDIVIKDCKLYEVEGNSSDYNLDFSDCLKALKISYGNQGDDKKSIEYYIKEREYKRRKEAAFLKSDLNYVWHNLRNLQKRERTISKLKSIGNKISKFSFGWLNYHYWGYGRKPNFVLRNSIYTILIFSVLYFVELTNWDILQMNISNLSEAFSTSVSSFSTLGFFTENAKNINKHFIILESLIGALNIGAFIGSLANQKY